MSHRCWNCGQRLAKDEILHPGVLTGPRVYFHRVAQRRQRGYGVWGAVLGATAVLWCVVSVVVALAR
jgi:predicted  nucleic acid-binding Zn-ribbon protein